MTPDDESTAPGGRHDADRPARDQQHRSRPTPGSGPLPESVTDWTVDQVEAAFAAIVSGAADRTRDGGAVPAAERLPDDQPDRCGTGERGARAVHDQVGRIASALFCAGRLDLAFVTFAVGRAAEHGRMDPDEVTDLVALRVLCLVAGLLASADPATAHSGHAADRRDPRRPAEPFGWHRPGGRADTGPTAGDVPTAEAA